MSWNHRVMRHVCPKTQEVWYGIHEVYYKKDGVTVDTYTENPVEPFGETPEELKRNVKDMLKAFKLPVLEYEE